MFELKCPSLDYVLDMTWREFQLRLLGYKRQEKNDWFKVRELAYLVYLSIPQKGSKMNKEKFMPLENKKIVKPSNNTVNRFLEEFKKYKLNE